MSTKHAATNRRIAKKRSPLFSKKEKLTPQERLAERNRVLGDFPILDRDELGYSPFHWILRTRGVQRLFTSAAWRIYTKLILHIYPEGYYDIETKTIRDDLGYRRNREVTSRLKELVKLGFIKIAKEKKKQYIGVLAPLHVVRRLIDAGTFSEEEIAEMVDDCHLYGVRLIQRMESFDSDLLRSQEEAQSSSVDQDSEAANTSGADEVDWRDV